MKKPIIGYGLQPDIFRNMFGYGNAQNGLMEIVIESGILGSVLYFLALYYAGRKANGEEKLYSIYLYVISFIIGSISEINLATHFVFGIGLLFAFGSQLEKDSNEKRDKKGFIRALMKKRKRKFRL